MASDKNTSWSVSKVSNNPIEKNTAMSCVIGLYGPPSPKRRLGSYVTEGDLKHSPSTNGANIALIMEQRGSLEVDTPS